MEPADNEPMLWQMRLIAVRACQLALQAEIASPTEDMFRKAANWSADAIATASFAWKQSNEDVAFRILESFRMAKYLDSEAETKRRDS